MSGGGTPLVSFTCLNCPVALYRLDSVLTVIDCPVTLSSGMSSTVTLIFGVAGCRSFFLLLFYGADQRAHRNYGSAFWYDNFVAAT